MFLPEGGFDVLFGRCHEGLLLIVDEVWFGEEIDGGKPPVEVE